MQSDEIESLIQKNIDILEESLSERKDRYRNVRIKIQELETVSEEAHEQIIYMRGQIDILKNLAIEVNPKPSKGDK